MAGIRFKIKVRLEGIQVKFDTATIVSRREGPASATISLAPTKHIPRILPKTLVHIFFWDSVDSDWHLLFEGETRGKGRVKEEGHRSFTVEAFGMSNHFYYSYVYMLNQDLGYNYADNIKLKGILSDKPYTVAQHFADRKNLLSGNIEDSFVKILGAPANVGNPFYSDAWSRLKLTQRINALRDSQVTQLYKKRFQLDQLWETTIRTAVSDVAPIANLTTGLARLLYYDWTEILTPSSMGTSIVFKPETYFCPAPRCNVFFPCRYSQFSEQRDFMAEPTRLILNTTLAKEQTGDGEITEAAIIRIAPQELQEKIDNISGKNVQNQLRDIATKVVTEEEKVKGIIPVFLPLSASEWVVTQAPDDTGGAGDTPAQQAEDVFGQYSDVVANIPNAATRQQLNAQIQAARDSVTAGKAQGTLDASLQAIKDSINQAVPGLAGSLPGAPAAFQPEKVGGKANPVVTISKDPLGWLSNIANYKFFLMRFANRGLSMNHSFNPWACAGFPGAVLDEFGNMFGMVETVQHNVSVDGGTTGITLTHVINPLDEDIPGAQVFPELPPWFSTQYATGSAYARVIGSPTVGNSAEACASALDDLMVSYKKTKNKLGMALSLNRRPIVTESDFYAFLGASGDTKATVLSGGPFRSANQAAIKTHVSFLAQRRGVPAP